MEQLPLVTWAATRNVRCDLWDFVVQTSFTCVWIIAYKTVSLVGANPRSTVLSPTTLAPTLTTSSHTSVQRSILFVCLDVLNYGYNNSHRILESLHAQKLSSVYQNIWHFFGKKFFSSIGLKITTVKWTTICKNSGTLTGKFNFYTRSCKSTCTLHHNNFKKLLLKRAFANLLVWPK